jgi:glutamate--cysteine ligase
MEIFAFHAGSLLPAGLEPGAISPMGLLERIAALVPGSKLKLDPAERVPTGVTLPSGANFSLEPGGQVEFASAPAGDMAELALDVASGLETLGRAAAGELLFLGTGTNPLSRPDHPLLLPKERYLVMTRYFDAVPGGRGVHMMRHTGTVQPNLDVPGEDDDWQDAVNLTFVLTPFARHLFANAPWFQGERSKVYSERQAIWPHVDPSRTLIPRGVPFAPDVPCAYARWAREASVFHVAGLPREAQPLPGELPFEKWLHEGYKGTRPTLTEWEQHLGTLFPDLRLRGFLEVRMVDAQPFEHMLAPIAFFAAALQRPRARTRFWEFLIGVARAFIDCHGESESLGAATSRAPSQAHVASAGRVVSPDAIHPDAAVFDALLCADPTHAVFADARLHLQLLQMAEEILSDARDSVGAQSLAAYSKHIVSRADGAEAPSARAYVERHATPNPAAAFLSGVDLSRAAPSGP